MNPRAAPLCALGAVGLWSTNAVVAKYALSDMTVAQVLALQFAGAAVTFLILGRSAEGSARARPSVGRYLLGLFGLVGTVAFQYIAFAIGPIASANLLAYAWPLATAAILCLLGLAAHPVRLVTASALGFGGVALLVGGADLSGAGLSSAFGLGAAALSALCMAVFTIGIAPIGISPSRLLLPASIVGCVGAGGWWVLGDHGAVGALDAVTGLYLGVGPMGLGYALWSAAM